MNEPTERYQWPAITTTRTTPRPGAIWTLLEHLEDILATLTEFTPAIGAAVILLTFALTR